MASFVEQTNALTARLNAALGMEELIAFSNAYGELIPELRKWKDDFKTKFDGTDEARAAVANYVEALGKIAERKAPPRHPAIGARRFRMPRKMSRAYCKKTPCRKMGFTQRSSCRPYKNCFTRRARRSG